MADGDVIPFKTYSSYEPMPEDSANAVRKEFGLDDNPPSPAAQILQEAIDLIEGDRAAQHGDKAALHATMAELFTAYLRAVGGPPPPPTPPPIPTTL